MLKADLGPTGKVMKKTNIDLRILYFSLLSLFLYLFTLSFSQPPSYREAAALF